jgi:hypothetical protein
MKKYQNQKGFSIIELVIILAVVGVLGFVGFKVIQSRDTDKVTQNSSHADNKTESDDSPPMLAKNIGFKFDYYDPQTKRAGDFAFSTIPAMKDPLVGNQLWMDYGESSRKPDSKMKNPQTMFLLPAGTKITAMVDGEVVGLTEFAKNDYGIMIAKDKSSKWRYEHEHIASPTVKLGDKVVAGDVIAEVGQHTNTWQYPGYGFFEIGLYRPHSNGVGGSEDCVFKYLDSSVKKDIQAKVSAFYKAWEEYIGDESIYDQENYASPGCAIEETISWEKPMTAPAN